jgi:hypothetical protein
MITPYEKELVEACSRTMSASKASQRPQKPKQPPTTGSGTYCTSVAAMHDDNGNQCVQVGG